MADKRTDDKMSAQEMAEEILSSLPKKERLWRVACGWVNQAGDLAAGSKLVFDRAWPDYDVAMRQFTMAATKLMPIEWEKRFDLDAEMRDRYHTGSNDQTYLVMSCELWLTQLGDDGEPETLLVDCAMYTPRSHLERYPGDVPEFFSEVE